MSLKFPLLSILVFTFYSIVTAHFTLKYPESRGLNEDEQDQFPCGGQNTISNQRTLYPLTGGAISLVMDHASSNVQVLIAFESEPTTSFNTVLRPTFKQFGMGDFCMTNINLPSSLHVSEGTNATIQIITNGDPDGGLYQCADITFGISAFDFEVCQNATGVTTSKSDFRGNANETSQVDQKSQKSGAIHSWPTCLSYTILAAIFTCAKILFQ
ncbi:Uncharacterized protein GcM1_242114 [Golovinomyces cichoracearum]|uniref:Copper acquisition factor BIM1-like domain-containing protein n=1 Tax=Golovinomyces cichoracearum TaxID=62708 RepID=A0A420IHA1_9PEZI|nr:Uncharacterized protein GcM1_242114 [Golovinomyces cichoracearum]